MSPLKQEFVTMSSKKAKKSTSGWKGAIQDAERHIERLKGVIAACEEKIAKGEPWPGTTGKAAATQN
jgi:hypothetical protein